MINKFKEYEFKISAYELALTTMNFDAMTVAPKLSSEYRNERMEYLSGEYYSIFTDKEFVEIIENLKNDNSLDFITKRKVELYDQFLNKTKNISKEEYTSFEKLKMDSYDAWEKARKENDYKIYEPFLLKLIETSKKLTLKREPNKDVYNVLLSDYEDGMDKEKYDEFFNLIKEEIVPLIKKITDSKQIKNQLEGYKFPLNIQKEYVNDILSYLRYTDDFGVCATSIHPFSSRLSKNDARITTRYNENDVLDSIFSVIHEVGHAMFEHQVADEIANGIIHNSISMGTHESQSRLFENCLGRSKAFWEYNYPILQNKFDFLKNISLDEFVNTINISKPSLIRVDADELTYPLHILIRYELEKGIFDGSVDINNLSNEWNKRVKEYLGIDVPNDLRGILQDIHWSDASFGYFPTYALGSAYAAQIFNKMKQEIDVDSLLRNNKYDEINNWLKEKIHKNAALYSPKEIILKATGEEFNPRYYVDYLKNKFSSLYNI